MLTVSLAVLFAAAAPQPRERLHVDWIAPQGCPTRAELAESLEAQVPRDHTFSASVRIDEPRRDGDPWRAVIVTTNDGVDRTRVIDGADCERVSSAAVLVVTLAATTVPAPDDVELPPPPDARVAAPPPMAPPEIDEKAPPPPESDEPTGRPPSFSVRLQPLIGANVGVFPMPGFSWGVAGSFMIGRIRAQAAIATWLTPPAGSGPGVDVGLTSGALRAAWLFEPEDAVHLGPSLTFEAGALSARGTGIAFPQESTVFWGAVLPGVTAGFATTSFVSPWVTAELGVNLARPSFFVSTHGQQVTVHRVGWLVGRLSVGIEFELSMP